MRTSAYIHEALAGPPREAGGTKFFFHFDRSLPARIMTMPNSVHLLNIPNHFGLSFFGRFFATPATSRSGTGGRCVNVTSQNQEVRGKLNFLERSSLSNLSK